jgi:hypothetical protein
VESKHGGKETKISVDLADFFDVITGEQQALHTAFL